MINSIIVIILCIIVIGILYKLDGCSQYNPQVSDINTLNTEHYVDIEGLNNKVQSLEKENLELLKLSDSLSLELYQFIARNKKKLKNGGSATIVESNIKANGTSKTDVIIKNADSICNPTYIDTITQFNNWITGTIIINKDSSVIQNLKIKDNFKVLIGSEKQGLFKKSKLFADIISDNPYKEISNIRSYQVTDNRKSYKLTIFGIGVGVGITTMLLLIK